MKNLLLLLTIVFIHSFSFAQSYNDKNHIDSPLLKEAIISCLSNAPKNTDNKPNREFVKKCLESKGIQAQKNTPAPHLSSFLKEKRNEALKQCSSSVKPEDKKAMAQCLDSKGISELTLK